MTKKLSFTERYLSFYDHHIVFSPSAQLPGPWVDARLARTRLWGQQAEEVVDQGRLLKPAEEGARKEVTFLLKLRKFRFAGFKSRNILQNPTGGSSLQVLV